MSRSDLSLKWLEAFQATAEAGSVQAAARRLELSPSTVSHHLSCLEAVMGAALLDHTRRPMVLTAEGQTLLARVDEALALLRKGVSEVWSQDFATMSRHLRFAMVEDFDTDIAPDLARALADRLPACRLSFLSRPSHDVLDLVQHDRVDLGVCAAPEFGTGGLIELPLLRDPFLLIAPAGQEAPAAAYLDGSAGVPFVRFSGRQIIGRHVEAQLRRLGLRVPARIEFESTLAMLSVVATGKAWTITTTLNYLRATRLHPGLRPLPFPAKGFARRISLFHAEALSPNLPDLMLAELRPLLADRLVAPTIAAHPWLDGRFRMFEDRHLTP